MRERLDTLQGNFCATCEQSFISSITVCPNDGTIFSDVRRIESLLYNRYQILSYVGSGGMGTIYKGKQQPLGRLVAIKMLKTLDALQCARFKQEAQLSSSLDHPNIIHIYDFGTTTDNHPFMVMDFVDGGDFSELLKQEGSALIECLHIFRQICDGMQHAHNKGIVHRDLKPSNIMLSDLDSSHPTVRIVDFGIAKALATPEGQQATKTSELFGSPYYMSPEQALGGEVDARADIYSLGCLMYEALTGLLPIAGNSPFNTLRMHVTDKPIALRERCPQRRYSEALEHIVMKCLAKEPAKRFQSMQELNTAISQLPESVTEGKRVFQSVPATNSSLSHSATSGHIAEFSTGEQAKKTTGGKFKFVLLAAVAATVFGGTCAFCLRQSNHGSPRTELETKNKVDDVDLAIQSLAVTATASHAKKKASAGDGSDLVRASDNDLLIVATPRAMKLNEIFVTGERAEVRLATRVSADATAEGVHIGDARLSDKALHCLRGHANIKHVTITHSLYSDDLLEPLEDMPQIQGLMLNTGSLSDNFVGHLKSLRHLTSLDLTGQKNLTAKMLDCLPLSLEDLNLRLDSGIESSKFSLLSRYSHLRNLDLSATHISDAGLRVLKKLPKLQQIELCNTAITDDGVEELLKLPNLKTVELTGSRISSEGLLKLAGSPSLTEIIIWNSPILTDDDFSQFRNRTRAIKLVPDKPNQKHSFKV